MKPLGNSTNGEAAPAPAVPMRPAFRLAQTGPLTAYSRPEAAGPGRDLQDALRALAGWEKISQTRAQFAGDG
jgi:hypothetical protein